MAEQKKGSTEKSAAKAEGSAPEPEAPEATTYPRERLITESEERFGHPPFVLAGALDGSKQNLTLDEAEVAVADFLKREVTTPAQED